MSENIFSTFSANIYELGYNVIPVHGKIAFTPGFQTWSTRRQEQIEIDQLIYENFDQSTGIGVVMGHGVFCIDVDTDDQRVIDLLPPTPMMKYGQKGITAFYRTNKEIRTKAETKVLPVELLGVGRYTVVPPSMHPTSKGRYEWRGEGLVELADLPLVDGVAVYESMKAYCIKHGITRPTKAALEAMNDTANSELGRSAPLQYGIGFRNNYLTSVAYSIACGMLVDKIDTAEAVDRLMEVDRTCHKSMPYFTDPDECKGKPSVQFASEFFHRALRAAEAAGDVLPFIDLDNMTWGTVTSDDDDDDQAATYMFPILSHGEYQEMLMSCKYMAYFARYVYEGAADYSPVLTMGGALALFSILSSNIYSLNGARTNFYIQNAADSGVGKAAPHNAVSRVLRESRGGQSLLGFDSYRSAQGIYTGFNMNPRHARIDIQDEIGELFTKSEGKESHVSAAPDVLNKLYSLSNDRLLKQAKIGADKGDGKVLSVSNPFLTWFATGTTFGFKSFIGNRSVVNKGLAGRMVFCIDDRKVEAKVRQLDRYANVLMPCDAALMAYVNELLSLSPSTPKSSGYDLMADSMIVPLIPQEVGISPEVMKYASERVFAAFDKPMMDMLHANSSHDEPPPIAVILRRQSELMMKLACVWWVAQGRPAGGVTREAFDWAIRIQIGGIAQVERVLTHGTSPTHSLYKGVAHWLLTKGERGARRDNVKLQIERLWGRLMHTTARPSDIDGILLGLLRDGTIVETGSKGASGVKYYALSRFY